MSGSAEICASALSTHLKHNKTKLMKNLKSMLVAVTIIITATFQLDAQNYLSVQGNKLIDSQGQEVVLTGVNWFGFETSNLHPHGIWSRDTKSMLQQIKDQGFNVIRLPWCNKILEDGVTLNIDAYGTDPYTGVSPMNEEESTLSTPLELMDVIVQWCQDNNMKMIFDNHSRQPDGYMNELLWYTDQTPESQWIADWVFLANRYKDYDAVIGMDLNNEPHGNYGEGATWGNSSPATDWNKAAERCGNAILDVNPNVLILVEGIEKYGDDVYWWGGNLKGVADYPVQLSNPAKLMYSPHEYGPTVHNQPWFSAPDFPDNMPGIWQEHFNFIHEQGISPLLIGEFGIRDSDGTDEIWFDTFMAYMGQKNYSWTFWCWNPNSGDTGGLLDDQWTNIVEWKMAKLRPYLAPEIPNGSSQPTNHAPDAVISALPVSGVVPLTVDFDASGSTDVDGDALTYAWSFGDGSTATGEMVSHTYTEIDNFQAVLTVTDSEGASDIASVTVQVISDDPQENTPPIAVISANPVDGTEPLTVSFSADGSSDVDGDVLTYTWDFGDGNTGSGITASNIYAAGDYTATLTVSDGEDSDVATIAISVDPSQVDPDPCDAPVTVSLPLNQNGASTACYVTSDEISYVNSWNMGLVEINGVDYTNTWSNNMPEKINGNYYIYCEGLYAWSHFEAATNKSTDKIDSFTAFAYPNPFKENTMLFIENPELVNDIMIVDQTGRLVESISGSEIMSQMQVGNNLDIGVYCIVIKTSQGVQTQIINKL